MKILVIGSGGREHAICHAFSKSRQVDAIYCANGNAGIAKIADCVAISPTDISGLRQFAVDKGIDLVFPGGETTLALGIVDELRGAGISTIGPTMSAARLEASKAFAKDFMRRHSVPTAAYRVANNKQEAIDSLEAGEFGDQATGAVVKADGLAAGKGVVVAAKRAVAISAINEMETVAGKAAASSIVIEEKLVGKEISLLMFADGESYSLMPATRDHKRIGEGDTGPNTGGMGAITDDALLDNETRALIERTVIMPTLAGCIAEGFPFQGVLFLGLMMTADGPKLLEYNVRFGDPETQAILVRLKTDLVDICRAMTEGSLGQLEIEWSRGTSACIVLASRGYPTEPQTGDTIHGLDAAADIAGVNVFHASIAAY